MNKCIYTLAFVLLFSCKTKNMNISKPDQKEQWVTAYKKAVIIATMKRAGIDLEKDNSQSILFEVLGTNLKALKEIDSLGSAYAKSILDSPSYFEGKPIITKVLNIYNGKELDFLAITSYDNLK